MPDRDLAAAPSATFQSTGLEAAGFEPTLVVSSRERAAGRVRRESELCVHVCRRCDVELADRYHFDCPECGFPEPPRSSCRTCGGEVTLERVRYVAHGRARGSVTKLVPGMSCRACGLSAVEELGLDVLGELANVARGPLVILPESGFYTADRIEVLADADVCGADEPEQVEKERDGMRLRVGSPSALFDAALPAISQHDPRDIFSPTLSLEPGPPYTVAQRRTAALLLAEVQRELGAPVTCWSASVGLSEEPLVDPVLSQQLMQWERDPGAVGLGLYQASIAGQAPGRFVSSVRLLWLVLGPEPGEGLPAALARRVSALAVPPLHILQQLWLAMHPGHPFELARVYASMQVFHERYTAPVDTARGAPLPWEEPDFEGYAAWLRRLVSALLASELDAGQGSTRPTGIGSKSCCNMALHSEGDPHQGSYLDVTTHKDMLQDVVRTSAYADAIRAVVAPGRRVIDFGSGTGVLAIFAARAGGEVDAIERTAMVGHAREIAIRSGCPQIRFHHADHESFRGDSSVDVIVSEWMGHAVFYESMLEPLISLRRRWLREGGVMIPASLGLECALVTDEALYEDGSFLETQPYGIDFGPIADLPLRQSRLVTLEEEQIASPVCVLGRLDMSTIERTPERFTATLALEREVTTYGLLVWFEAQLAPGVTLGTGPHHPPTHWRQVFLPFPQPLNVTPGRPVHVEIAPPRDVEKDAHAWGWAVSHGSSSIRVDERDSLSRSRRL